MAVALFGLPTDTPAARRAYAKGRGPATAGRRDTLLTLTDKQFERMRIFHGRAQAATERPPEQITFL